MIIQHVLRDFDTIRSLANQYLSDPNEWYRIIELNKLDHPYIVADRKEIQTRASGYVQVVRSAGSSALTIQKGWTFHTKPSIMGGEVKTFEVIEDTTIPYGVSTYSIPVQCTVEGSFGNVYAHEVTELGEDFRKNNTTFESVFNPSSMSGRDIKVLATGDIILIPTDLQVTDTQNLEVIADLIADEDLALTPSIGYAREFKEDGFGDLESFRGIDNIVQAVNDRLMTELGELPLHPEYGTNLPNIVGSPRTPFTEMLAEIEIYQALSREDRIRDVQIKELRIEQTTVFVALDYKPRNLDRTETMRLTLNYRN